MVSNSSNLSYQIKHLTAIGALATICLFANLARSEIDPKVSSPLPMPFTVHCILSKPSDSKTGICSRLDDGESLVCAFDDGDSVQCESSRGYKADCASFSSSQFTCRMLSDVDQTKKKPRDSSQAAKEFNIYCDYNGGETGSCFRLDNREPLGCLYASQDFIRCKSKRGYRADCLYYGSNQFACKKLP